MNARTQLQHRQMMKDIRSLPPSLFAKWTREVLPGPWNREPKPHSVFMKELKVEKPRR